MVVLKKLENGFDILEIDNEFASAKIALQGGHIYHYERADDKQVLWVSPSSDLELGKAIRGGIPLCWPWFGMNKEDENLPQHGFVRTSLFHLESSQKLEDGSTQVILLLCDSKESRSVWNHRFELRVEFIISDSLEIKLTTKNLDDQPFTITQALHTYFEVSNINDVKITGLEEKPYFDALTTKGCVQKDAIIFEQEVDRVYQEVQDAVFLKDATRSIQINNQGSSSVVVWNPWIEKTKRMSAMNDDAYKTMVCIESANALDDERSIQAQENHTITAIITPLKED